MSVQNVATGNIGAHFASPFTDYGFGKSGGHLIPSLAYVRPEPSEGLHVVVGTDAVSAAERHPIRKAEVVYGNLKSLFKSDLILDEKDPRWQYKFDRNLGFGEATAFSVSKEFIQGVLRNLNGFDLPEAKKSVQFYLGKPAYDSLAAERRYEKRLKRIFAELGFEKPPILVYEPYAVYYFCRFLLEKPFVRESSPRASRVLVVDHGGGTINSCVVEIDREGEIKTARPKGAQARAGGGSLVDQYLLRKKIREAQFSEEVRAKILDKERLIFPRRHECLMEIEKAKIALTESGASVSTSMQLRLGLQAAPDPWHITLTAGEIEEAFSYVWNQHCKTCISATLGTDDANKIDYVILAGGSCRLRLHKKYIERDFGEFLNQGQTEFFDVGDADKPLALGLCFQGYIELGKQAPSLDSSNVSQRPQQENLSDYIARDIFVALRDEDTDDASTEAVLVAAGSAKEDIWKRGSSVGLRTRKKLRKAFRFAVASNKEALSPKIDGNEFHLVQVRHKMLDKLERHIKVELEVNDEGVCHPRFRLAPHKHPSYFEPDKQSFHIVVPDLARGRRECIPLTTTHDRSVFAFDFGTCVSRVSSLSSAAMKRALDRGVPIITGVGKVEYAREYLEVRAPVIDFPSSEDAKILGRLDQIDPSIAASFRQFLADIRTGSRLSYKGTACELRAVIELLLDNLAPEEEVGARYKTDPQTGRVPYANRARYILEQKRGKEIQDVKKRADAVLRIDESVGSILRGVHRSTSAVVHVGAADELQELHRLHSYFRALANDLLF